MTYDARRIQQPPPEEYVAVPVVENVQRAMARRLANAYKREDALRHIRVCDQDARMRVATDETIEKWMRVARAVLLEGIDDPERFMRAAFTQSIARDTTLAFGPATNGFDERGFQAQVDNYRRYCMHADTHLAEDWDAYGLEFEVAVRALRTRFPQKPQKELWHFVLMNKFHMLSPLFKYCIAASEDIPEVVNAVHSAALLQFLGDPKGYIRVWKEKIPLALKEEAEQILGAKL